MKLDEAVAARKLWLADIRRRYLILRGLGVLVVAAVVITPVVAGILGWRAQSMTTPSMGRTAPVGSLVVTRPVTAGELRVGDMIAFHPPNRSGTTFVHRVTGTRPGKQGVLVSTKGDINGAVDSWQIADGGLIGRVAFVIPEGGYVLQILPLVLLGFFVVALATAGVQRSRRGPARILLASLVVAGVITWIQPLARLDLIAQVREGSRTTAAVVPTGMLPLRVHAIGGTKADLTPGQVGTLATKHVSRGGGFRINAGVHLHGWWWLLAITWLVPLAAAIRYRIASDTPLIGPAMTEPRFRAI